MSIDWPTRDILETVGSLATKPGELVHGSIDAGVAKIPLIAIAGVRPGPVLYVQALQHGLELNGCDVMRRLIQRLEPSELSGTLILVPMANPLAARVHMQSFPYPDRATHRKINDMNRRWTEPLGGPNHVDQMVAALAPVVKLADAIIDLHCHEYLYSTMVMTNMHQPDCAEFALAMGFPYVSSGTGVPGMFGMYCRETLGKIVATVEMPPLRRVDHANSAAGFRGVLNALKSMGMLPGEPQLPPTTAIFGTGPQESKSVLAEREGFLSRYVSGGEFVTEGQLVAEIWDPEEFRVVQGIHAPFDACVTSIGRPPQAWGDPEHDFMNIDDRAVTFTVPSQIIERE
ncbi:MAG: succinylglutamate desuccinylase/aspartoacylase family protein [Lentisphaeria bacterium]|nr:succinylglutamate desuccinylase/aspartoacylase family protein [Lentisphaeria bacterium]